MKSSVNLFNDTENNDEITDVDWTIWKLNEKKEYELFEDYTIVTTKDNKDSIKITQSGNYKIIANIFKSDNKEKIPELKERKSVLINVINNRSNLINKTKDGKYEIIYDKDNTNVYYLDKNVITNEITEIKQNDDMYRKLSTALGIEKKITNEKLKEQMLDNGYCFVNNVGWIKQQDYNEHREGENEKEELTSNNIEFGIYNTLLLAISEHNEELINNLSDDKASSDVKTKWCNKVKEENTTENDFELYAEYKESDQKLRLYYRIKNDNASKIEILSIDALSQVASRRCPVGDDLNLSAEDASKKKISVCKTSPNRKFYVPQKFPKSTSTSPWKIKSIEDLQKNEDPNFLGPKKIRTNAYINVNVWKFDYQNATDKQKKWIKTSEIDKDEGYLIHGGDGSFKDKNLVNDTDKAKGNNRYNTNTQGCIRINNKDVYLLIDILKEKLPISLEVY